MAQFNTRIALKSDTEDKWKLIDTTFIPLSGEMIIYSADNTHSYCRVKIGDGNSTLRNLSFIDSGTINGNEVEIVKLASFADRPSPGSPDKLYVDMSTNSIYHYDGTSGYTQLSNFTLSSSKVSASNISNWSAGIPAKAEISNNILYITNGVSPTLSYINQQVVNNVEMAPNQQG